MNSPVPTSIVVSPFMPRATPETDSPPLKFCDTSVSVKFDVLEVFAPVTFNSVMLPVPLVTLEPLVSKPVVLIAKLRLSLAPSL